LLNAFQSGNLNILKYLIQQEAYINEKDYKKTQFLIACENRNKNIINYCIKLGAKIDKKVKTLLHMACRSGNTNLVIFC